MQQPNRTTLSKNRFLLKKCVFIFPLILFLTLLIIIPAKAIEQDSFFQENIPSVEFSVAKPILGASNNAKGEFKIKVKIPKDHHAYLDSGEKGLFIPLNFDFSGVESAGYKVSSISKPGGALDEEFEATVLRGTGEFKFYIERVKGREFIIPPIKAQSQICNDFTKVCYLPQFDNIPFLIKQASQSIEAAVNQNVEPASLKIAIKASIDSSEGEGFTGKVSALYKKYSQNFLLAFIFILISGILSAGTPCVYPMIPITSAIIMNRGGSDRQLGIYHSFSYFLGVIFLYMLLGYIAGMTGGAFNAVMQSSFVNIFFAVLFGFFGLAMLGFFDFSMGENVIANISAKVGAKGGFVSTFFLGITAGLIISPCVGPVVFTLLLQVADNIADANTAITATGREVSFMGKSVIAAKGGLLMGGFGIGIGTPLLLVGLLSNRMPRAGKWMDYIKYSFGVIILYIAWTYYMKGSQTAGINEQAANMILIGVASIIISIYLGLFRPVKSKLKKGIAFFLILPAFYFLYNGLSQGGIILSGKDASNSLSEKISFTPEGFKIEKHENLVWYRDFDNAKKVALKENKPIFVDFFAYWCANCLEFDKLSVKNKKLEETLGKAVLVKIYDTDPAFKIFQENPQHRELKRGLPYFVIFKPNGEFFWEGTQYNAIETMVSMINAAQLIG